MKGDANAPSPGRGRNHRNRCQGRSVIRYKDDVYQGRERIHKRGEPILDEDYARQYRPCEGWGAHGTNYCANHGGNASQVINAAKRTLALSADDAAALFVEIAKDARVPFETRIKAAVQILDRVGMRGGVDVSLETPGWQKLLGSMFGMEPEAELEPEAEPEETSVEPRPRKAAKPKFQGW
jgi:hypothetical protein